MMPGEALYELFEMLREFLFFIFLTDKFSDRKHLIPL
jgi:hypothetical protein